MYKFTFLICCLFSLCFAGCEDADILLVTEAGVDAVKATTLSDEEVQNMAQKSSKYADSQQRIAPPENKYAKRLKRLVGERYKEG